MVTATRKVDNGLSFQHRCMQEALKRSKCNFKARNIPLIVATWLVLHNTKYMHTLKTGMLLQFIIIILKNDRITFYYWLASVKTNW